MDGASRLSVEELVVLLLAFLEQLGAADAPSWPAIAVTPLALYRVLVPNGSAAETTADPPTKGLLQPGGTLLT